MHTPVASALGAGGDQGTVLGHRLPLADQVGDGMNDPLLEWLGGIVLALAGLYFLLPDVWWEWMFSGRF